MCISVDRMETISIANHVGHHGAIRHWVQRHCIHTFELAVLEIAVVLDRYAGGIGECVPAEAYVHWQAATHTKQ